MQPRYYQQDSHDAAWRYLHDKEGNPLIVLPTGAGKSLVIAMLVRQALKYGARVILLQHRKELIQQNREKINVLLPETEVGIYSAGLNRREIENDVIAAGIQSIYKQAHVLGRRELVIVDEAHLINPKNDKTMYRRFLEELRAINPTCRVIGLTATPFRLGSGSIVGDDSIFQQIVYNAKTGDLISQGWLCEITNKTAAASVDVSELKTKRGEFTEASMFDAFTNDGKVDGACAEIVEATAGRKSILLFTINISHAVMVQRKISDLTRESVELVTGDTLPLERAAILEKFRSGELRWLVNCNVLTTGFDAPRIDAIGILRATKSPALFAQIVGRGLRQAEGKDNCLILDFGTNIRRHGSLDDDNFGNVDDGSDTPKKEGEVETRPCPSCGIEMSVLETICSECGFVQRAMSWQANHGTGADEDNQLTGAVKPVRWYVERVTHNLHRKRNSPDSPPTLRVTYHCQPENPDHHSEIVTHSFSEWICFEHFGYARTKAEQWWEARSYAEIPETVEEAIVAIQEHKAVMSKYIHVKRDGRYDRITKHEVDDPIPEENDYVQRIASAWAEDVPF